MSPAVAGELATEPVSPAPGPVSSAPGPVSSQPGPDEPRIAFVTQWFPPEPAGVPLGIVQSLRRRGVPATVVTGVPNYPDGTVHAGYSAWRGGRERVDGFDVVRAPLYPSHGRSARGRIANLASYAATSTVAGSRALRSADAALVYSSPATAATAAIVAKLISGTPYLLLILDLWPDSVFATGFLARGLRRRLAMAVLGRFTRLAYRHASHIAVTSPGMRSTLLARGVPADKVSIVYNWADEKAMRPTEPDPRLRAQLGLTDEFVLMYAGNHGAAQSLDTAIEAMARLRDLPNVRLVLVGDGIDKPALQRLAADLGLDSAVHFLDRVDTEHLPGMMAAADMQLVSLADQELFRITVPGKVQCILACGQPVLLAAAGDAAQIVEESGAGLVCPPGDPNLLASAIRRASAIPRADLRQMGHAGYGYYHAVLSEDVNAGRLAELLRAAVQARRTG
ncbi:MAG TPA: glycosyltransferase family 4 protein [Rugosimonospora sp.]|nr:glycosyltransferase family 4 protein [Rugosimonospora sp.]